MIIPVFNADRFVESTIRSAAAQTYSKLQIIAIDDGSTDTSPDILRRLSHELPNLIVRSVSNGGVARARNLGTEIAQGDLVAYLDADDLWHPTKIEKQVAALMRHAGDDEWGACYVFSRIIDENDFLRPNRTVHKLSGALFCSHLVFNPIGNGSGFMVRRDIALEVGGFEPEYADNGIGGCEDWDFQLRVVQRYKMEVVPEFLVGYRIYAGNMSSHKERMARSRLAVIKRFAAYPNVEAAVRRKALSVAHRAAYRPLWRKGHYASALRSLAQQFTLDPRAGLAEFRRKAISRVDRLRWGDPDMKDEPAPANENTPVFSSMDPTDGAERVASFPATRFEEWLSEMDRQYYAAVSRSAQI